MVHTTGADWHPVWGLVPSNMLIQFGLTTKDQQAFIVQLGDTPFPEYSVVKI